MGSRVCVPIQLTNRSGNVFVEGVITKILNDTKQFVVQTTSHTGNPDFRTVKRGQLRLLRPPWWDELNDWSDNSIATLTEVANVPTNIYNTGIGGHSTSNTAVPVNRKPVQSSNNSRLKYSRIDQTGPLQIHHVLPTLQVNFLV